MSWYVANDEGVVAGHDMTKVSANILANKLKKEYPDQNWEALPTEEEL